MDVLRYVVLFMFGVMLGKMVREKWGTMGRNVVVTLSLGMLGILLTMLKISG
ncbi:MAG: hypothetical protein ACTSQA_01185 [Candidatus Heimdallarchaeaceae archaeon]